MSDDDTENGSDDMPSEPEPTAPAGGSGDMLEDMLENYNSSKYELMINENIEIQGRKNLIRRKLSSLSGKNRKTI